ncbi:hypothetical protein ZIOFF_021699 [Zingiber officinale]|uniref:Uncharacterized protein n=1 Tax=Zingiber officinale TaxID=94328 RepID=A0A8J5H8P6_ZINOF|nr:hypothetical protein ZIOFF_021699 [Zingiber officinale]
MSISCECRQEFAAMGTLKQNYASILMLLLRLRQACDHPLLVKGFHTDTIGKDSLDMARQLPREMLINLRNQLEGLAICTICSDPPEDGVVSMCGHVFCYQCVSERLIGDTCPAPGCKDILGTDCVFSRGTLKSCICENFDDETSTSSTFDEQQITHSGYVSSKIKAALDILTTIASQSSSSVHDLIGDSASAQLNLTTEVPEKAIVFSQWTSMLDLLELSLNENLIQYRRLDGTMTLVSRDKAVKDFNTDPEVTVMLMSLKAGSLGLNMIAACHVILLDLWWNPSTEDQAIDRAHRIGQTRPVTVSRITVKDTVEDRILALQFIVTNCIISDFKTTANLVSLHGQINRAWYILQEEKRKMVSSAFGEDQTGTHATRLTVDDLRYMFNCYD